MALLEKFVGVRLAAGEGFGTQDGKMKSWEKWVVGIMMSEEVCRPQDEI